MANEKAVKAAGRRVVKKMEEAGEPILMMSYNPFGGGMPGASDFIVCYYGLFVAIECKDPARVKEKNGGLSPNQMNFRQNVAKAGGAHFLAYGREDFVKAFALIKTGLFGAEDAPAEPPKKKLITLD